jgi:hypothetical protein|tara:strand:+ start:50 stop:487 length:438 start_codon:yes stop_codon:yes gene_type:complete
MVPHSKYKYGDVREDGYVWVGIRYNRKRPDGTYPDDFRHPEAFKKILKRNQMNKKKIYDEISRLTSKHKVDCGCQHCGYNKEAVALDFHHLDRDTKHSNVSRFWRTSWRQFLKMKEEWAKCIVLCANCHRIEESRIRWEGKRNEN